MPQPRVAFNTSWSPALAYAVGLLVTDGNLSTDGRHIAFRSSDKDLIETFNYCLNLTNKISETTNNGFAKKPSYRVQFGNTNFYEWLNKIGLTANKTYSIGAIDIPDEYFRDFLRGHLDGDGTILTYMDKYNEYKGRTYNNLRIIMYFISASQVHINWLFKKIQNITGIKGSLTSRPANNISRVPMWRIKFSKKDSLKLLEWMYYQDNLPCLERKRILVRKIFSLVENEKRKVYTRIEI